MNNYLNYILCKKNISKTELSKISGVNRTTIAKLCSDKKYRKGMRIDTAYNIAKGLNIPLDEFIKQMCDIDYFENKYQENKKEIVKKKYNNTDIINKIDTILEKIDYIESRI